MNRFIGLRDEIRKFILAREMLFLKVWSALVTFVGLMCIKANFGYNKTVSQTWVLIVISLACAFFPISGVSIVLTIVLLVDLMSLSLETAIVGLGIIVAGYLICAYFRSKNTYNMVMVPVCYSFNAPFIMSLGSGLLSSINELCSIICGSITAYYLHIVKDNAASIIDDTSDVSIVSLLSEQMLRGRMFYFFLAAMIVMFLSVYILRQYNINLSWIVANLVGVVLEFIIMLAGLLVTSQREQILGLIIGNIVVVLVGFVLNYFILDLDYSRIEKVQFEDDDYYYYVTAVPKIRIVEEDKEVKKI